MTPHPHKDILIAIANGLNTDEIEVKQPQWGEWHNASEFSSWMNPVTAGNWQVRRVPKTILFNRQQLPMPMESAPELGTSVYVPEVYIDRQVVNLTWCNTTKQQEWFKKGLIHSTKEAAFEWANAMIPFNKK